MTSLAYHTDRDVLTADGPDAEAYLHGQISQNVDDMVDGESRLSFLLEPRGNIESCFRITRVGEGCYVLDTEVGHGELLQLSLERFKLRSKIEFVAQRWKMVSVFGGYEAIGIPEETLIVESSWSGVDHIDLLGRDLAVELPDCSGEEYERLRFRHGLPVIGKEFQVGAIPNETDLLNLAVSFDKGCYRGQELVERIDSRKGGRQLLRRIRSEVSLSVAENLFEDGQKVGEVVAATSSPSYFGFASVKGEVGSLTTEAGEEVTFSPLNEVL